MRCDKAIRACLQNSTQKNGLFWGVFMDLGHPNGNSIGEGIMVTQSWTANFFFV